MITWFIHSSPEPFDGVVTSGDGLNVVVPKNGSEVVLATEEFPGDAVSTESADGTVTWFNPVGGGIADQRAFHAEVRLQGGCVPPGSSESPPTGGNFIGGPSFGEGLLKLLFFLFTHAGH